jgi:dihydrofolate synthase/folylpolyglutamate synthase
LASEPALAAAPDSFSDLIEPFSRRGVDLGLDRLQVALAELGHPERRFAAVQVAGTNGKGSICTLVHQALLASGIRAGLYTSPHLVSWTERIRLGDAPIAAPALRRHLETASAIAQNHQLTPFELITAAAFLAFAEANCELVVLEVGLGGRLDATTCHPQRPVIGFASVGLDHAEFLGPDPATIATEKAGVLQPGAVAISAPQSSEVAAVFEARAEAAGAELRWVAPLDLEQWPLGLPGGVQAHNGAVALGMLQALAERGWPVSDAAIRQGFATAHWPGRLQRLSWRGQPLLVDGAHNLPAAIALRAELDGHPERDGLPPGPRRWVLGILANKQGPEIVAALLTPDDHGRPDRAWIVPVPGHASWSHAALRDALAATNPTLAKQLQPAPDLEVALGQAAADGSAADTRPVMVAGSLYLIGHLLSQPLLS